MNSIRRRLISGLVLGVVALVIVAGAGLNLYVGETLEHSLDATLTARAEALAAMVLMEDDGQPHLRIPAAVMGEFGQPNSPIFFQIWHSDGRTLARSASLRETPMPQPRPGCRFGNVDLPGGGDGRAIRLAFNAQPDFDDPDKAHYPLKTEPLSMVLALESDRAIDTPMAALFTGLVAAAGLLIAGVVVIVNVVVRRGLRPLDQVASAVDRVGPEALDVRLPTDALPVELAPITSKFNELLDRLQAAFTRERRFSADVAHELRTPIAELRSLCEVALRWPDDATPASATAGEALAIAKQMESTVQALLTLVRCQAGQVAVVAPEPIDAGALLKSSWAAYEADALRRNLRLEWDVPVNCVVVADKTILSLAVKNLLLNAVQHAPTGGQVRVTATATDDTVTLVIANTNDTLDRTDLPHLFEPFWRKDAARTGGVHAGLGLPIVKGYCEAMSVPLTADLPKPEWFEVRLTLTPTPDVAKTMARDQRVTTPAAL